MEMAWLSGLAMLTAMQQSQDRIRHLAMGPDLVQRKTVQTAKLNKLLTPKFIRSNDRQIDDTFDENQDPLFDSFCETKFWENCPFREDAIFPKCLWSDTEQ